MRLLLAVDATSARSVAHAATELFPTAQFVVFSAVEPTIVPAVDPALAGSAAMTPMIDTTPAGREQAYEAITDTCAELSAPASSATALCEAGPAICEEAARIGAAAIVLGRSERGWLSRLIDPSTATYVVRHASCAVVVVPTEAHDAPQADAPE